MKYSVRLVKKDISLKILMILGRPTQQAAASDHLANAWFHTYGFPVIRTNCSNNFGPYQFPEKLIPLSGP